MDSETIQDPIKRQTIKMTLRYAFLAPDQPMTAVEALDWEKSHNYFHNTSRYLSIVFPNSSDSLKLAFPHCRDLVFNRPA